MKERYEITFEKLKERYEITFEKPKERYEITFEKKPTQFYNFCDIYNSINYNII